MNTTIRTLVLVAGLAACSSGPTSSATLELAALDGTTQTAQAVGEVAWSGGGEQIVATMPPRGTEADDALILPLRITRMGAYTAASPVTVRATGRSWVSDIDDAPEILVDKLWFTGNRDYPWRHFGTVEVSEPRPADHSLELLSFRAEFSIQGPDCSLANEGESRCGVPWGFDAGTVELSITELVNDCPDYVVETWIDASTATATSFQIQANGFEGVTCLDLGDGRRLCGAHEDEMEVGDCFWNAAIRLATPDELHLDGVARCGEDRTVDTCNARFKLE